MPLLIRSAFDLGVSITDDIVGGNSSVIYGLIVAPFVIDGLCWLLIFIGIVFVSNQDLSSPTPPPFDIERMQGTTDGVLIADKSGS